MSKKSFIKAINSSNIIVEDCIFKGDRNTIDASHSNVKLKKTIHIVPHLKKHPIITTIIITIATGLIVGVILLQIEYKLFIK